MPRTPHCPGAQPDGDAQRRDGPRGDAGHHGTMCAGAIGWAQIPRIVYGTADPKRGFHCIAPKALHPKATVTSGVLEEECAALMTSFFRQLRVSRQGGPGE